MSSFSRRSFLALTAALGGCGFTPVYGPASRNDLTGQILVDTPDDRNSFVLTHAIEDRLGRTNSAQYGLSVTLDLSEEERGITPAEVTTRYTVIGVADFVLRDMETGNRVTSGRVKNFTGYSATGTTVSQLTSQRDATERLVRILADQIVSRLVQTSDDWR